MTENNNNCKCKCNQNRNCADWYPMQQLDKLIKQIERETVKQTIANLADECLHLMSLMDACNYMTRHKYAVTATNIDKFKEIAFESYFIRLKMMEEMLFK